MTGSSVKTLCCQIKPLVFQAEICPQPGFDVASNSSELYMTMLDDINAPRVPRMTFPLWEEQS